MPWDGLIYIDANIKPIIDKKRMKLTKLYIMLYSFYILGLKLDQQYSKN